MRGSFSAWGIRAVGFLVLAVLSRPATAGLVQEMDLDVLNPEQMIIVGVSPDSPAAHVDDNITTSPLAGVGSIFVDTGGGVGLGGTGSVIGRNLILTAAHLFDLDKDGSIDVAPGNVTFYLNYGGNQSHAINASNLYVHPDWTGFDNPAGTVNDDVAVIELESPVPAGVPIYGLDASPFDFVTPILLVGYGRSGDGFNGEDPDNFPFSFSTKRVGWNWATYYGRDDEGSPAKEVFYFDFDGQVNPATGMLVYDPVTGEVDPQYEWYWDSDHRPWLGFDNDVEVTLGRGDSGGPSLVSDGMGGFNIFGINTFGMDYLNPYDGHFYEAPLFGSFAGGMRVGAYKSWIESIPEPSSIVIWLIGGLGVVACARRRRKTAR